MRVHDLLALLPYLALAVAAPTRRGGHSLAKRACPGKASTTPVGGIAAVEIGGWNGGGGEGSSHAWGGWSGTKTGTGAAGLPTATAASASVGGIAAVEFGGWSGGGGEGSSHAWGGWSGTKTGTGAAGLPTATAASASVGDIAAVEFGSWSGGGGKSSAAVTGGGKGAGAETAASVGTTHAAGTPPAATTAPVVQSASTKSAAPSPAAATTSASSTSGSTGSGGGVGLGVDDAGWQGLSNLKGLDWYWNWGLTPFDVAGVEFVPCVWGKEMAGDVASTTFPSGSTHIMGFNEPDQTSSVGGSEIDAAEAATLHQQWTTALTADLKIGSPAVARGGTTWFNAWLDACAGNCKYDFVPLHFYGTSATDLISYVKAFPAGGKPIWVTEFDCQDFSTGYVCTAAEVNEFMTTAVQWFRGAGSSYVERWAWFGALPKMSTTTNGLEAADASINALGTAYLAM